MDVLMEEATQPQQEEEEANWSNTERYQPRKVHPFDPTRYFLQ